MQTPRNDDMMLVRLKPYNPKRGHVMKRYTVQGQRFDAVRGWYRVSPDLAEYLRTITQNTNDPDSPEAFDVCSQDEAIAIEERERKQADERARATDPHNTVADLTTAELRQAAAPRLPARRVSVASAPGAEPADASDSPTPGSAVESGPAGAPDTQPHDHHPPQNQAAARVAAAAPKPAGAPRKMAATTRQVQTGRAP